MRLPRAATRSMFAGDRSLRALRTIGCVARVQARERESRVRPFAVVHATFARAEFCGLCWLRFAGQSRPLPESVPSKSATGATREVVRPEMRSTRPEYR